MSLAKVENNPNLFDEKNEGLKRWTPNAAEMREISVFQKGFTDMGWAMAETIYMYHKLYPEKVAEYNSMSPEERLLAYPLRDELKYKGGEMTIIPDAVDVLEGEFKPNYDEIQKEVEQITDE